MSPLRTAAGRPPTTDLLVRLGDATVQGRVGAKAAALGRMIRLQLPVPDGFVLTDDTFQAFLGANDLVRRAAEIARSLAAMSDDETRSAAAEMRRSVLAASLPSYLGKLLATRRSNLGRGRLAVRSSAIGEDSHAASFAGQLDSILGVDEVPELELAVLRVWASYWSERALLYQRARGVRLAGMAVIVQHEVDAALAGVLFTRAPAGSADDLLGEYVIGLGEPLVAGEVDPGRFRIDRGSGEWQELARLPGSEHRGPGANSMLLNDARMREFRNHALALEEHFACPQDIEWAIGRDGAFMLLQSRAITTAVPPRPPTADHREVTWSNANVNENFPAPVTPFLYSIASLGYTHYFTNLARAFGISQRRIAAMGPALDTIIGSHGARIYYNLTSIHGVLRMAPFGSLLSAAFNRFVGADEVPPPAPEEARFADRGRAAQAIELAVIALNTSWQYLFLDRRVGRFESTVDRFAEQTHPRLLADRPLTELAGDLAGFLEIRRDRWLGASLADTAAMVTFAALERLLARTFPDEPDCGLANRLLQGLEDLASNRPILALWDLAARIRADHELCARFAVDDGAALLLRIHSDPRHRAVAVALDDYLERWGFRCSGELMLTVASFTERPADLLEILRAYVAPPAASRTSPGQPDARPADVSPVDTLRRLAAGRRATIARIEVTLARERRLPFVPRRLQAPLIRVVLRLTHASIALRERARLKQALLYQRCRRIALALGDRLVAAGLLAAPDDAFFFTASELIELATGRAMMPHAARDVVRVRRQAHERLGALRLPDTLRLGPACYVDLDAQQSAPSATTADDPLAGARDAAAGGAGQVLTGVAASAGRAHGPARVLDDVFGARRLERGDLLVTRQTDPGWGPVFPLISGLVLERGGMLSHGAILAREFGIPTVVGVRDATRVIRDGNRLDIDGDRGRVVVHD